MHRLLTAAAVALLLFAGLSRAEPDRPGGGLTYPPRPEDKAPPDPDSDTPPLPGESEPDRVLIDTPWHYCLDDQPACAPWYLAWCGTPAPRHAPEPGTLALLALGAAGLVVARGRRDG